MTGAEAVQQVLTRVLEKNNSPVAQMGAGTGPSAVTITTSAQIITFLNEGKNILCRTPLLELRGSAVASVSSGVRRVDFEGLTTTPTNRTLWAVRSAKWVASSVTYQLKVAGSQFYDVYYPTGLESGVPTYVFDLASAVLLGPLPAGSGTLTMQGLLLGKTIASGDTIEDVPAPLQHHLFEWGCYQLCLQNAQNERFAAVLPFWEAVSMAWAKGVV